MLLLNTLVRNISSGVYFHIRQHLLAPTAGSLAPGFHRGLLSEDIFLSVTALYWRAL